jgi:hypothetical protein
VLGGYFDIQIICRRPVRDLYITQKFHNENNDNIWGENIQDTVGNCMSQYNILSYHGAVRVLKDHYLVKVQLRRLEIS